MGHHPVRRSPHSIKSEWEVRSHFGMPPARTCGVSASSKRAGGLVAVEGSLQRLPAEQTKDGNEPHLCQLETNLSRLNRRRVRVPQGGEHA